MPTLPATPPARPLRLFRLDASLRTDGSISRTLADVVEQAWVDRHPDGEVVRRDLGHDPLPPVWPAAAGPFVGGAADEGARRLCAALVDELLGCDAYVFAVPMYNFGVPQQVKHWIDLVITDSRAADVAVPLLPGRPAILVEARGGGYGPGTPRDGWNHATPFLDRILGDVWGLHVDHVAAELTAAELDPALDHLRPLAREALATAHDTARRLGAAMADDLLTAPA